MVDAIPNLPSKISPAKPSIKIATPEFIIQSDTEVQVEVMTNLIFEEIGGQEIINISRNDLINGQNVVYQPIKNLSYISSQYNSNNIIPLGQTQSSYFNNFPIKLEEKIPEQASGYISSDLLSSIRIDNHSYIYLDESDNLVIELINMKSDEQVEVQIITSADILDDTIYEES